MRKLIMASLLLITMVSTMGLSQILANESNVSLSIGLANQQWRVKPVGNGYYNIVARHSGKCLDVKDAILSNGAIVHQWSCVGVQNQQWKLKALGNGYYNFIARHSGKCLEVKNSDPGDGATVQQWSCVGIETQQLRLSHVDKGADFFYDNIIARHSAKCLDVKNASLTNGAIVHQWKCIN